MTQRVVRAHELDDFLHSLFFEPVADVDQSYGSDAIRVGRRVGNGNHAAEGSPDNGHLTQPEVIAQRRQRCRDSVTAEVAGRIGIPMVREVWRQDVVPLSQRRPKLLEHVSRLPATVQAQNRCAVGRSPFEVMHLSIFDQRESAAPARRHIVPRHLNHCIHCDTPPPHSVADRQRSHNLAICHDFVREQAWIE